MPPALGDREENVFLTDPLVLPTSKFLLTHVLELVQYKVTSSLLQRRWGPGWGSEAHHPAGAPGGGSGV